MSTQVIYASIFAIAIFVVIVAYFFIKIRRRVGLSREVEKRREPTPESEKERDAKEFRTNAPEIDPEPAMTAESVLAAQGTSKIQKEYADWIDSSEVTREFAAAFVKACAYWDHPKSYSWVLAPGHAQNLYMSSFGWTVDFGANSFLVEKAIERSRNMFKRALAGYLSPDKLSDAVRRCVAGAVANNGSEYNGDYPVDRQGFMRFGTQGINVNDASKFLIRIAELKLDD